MTGYDNAWRCAHEPGKACPPGGCPLGVCARRGGREPMVHELKTWPDPFTALRSGAKRHEVRDVRGRDFRVGDHLRLREYVMHREYVHPCEASLDELLDDGPSPCHGVECDGDGYYTGAEHWAEITYLTEPGTFGLPEHMAVLSLRNLPVVTIGDREGPAELVGARWNRRVRQSGPPHGKVATFRDDDREGSAFTILQAGDGDLWLRVDAVAEDCVAAGDLSADALMYAPRGIRVRMPMVGGGSHPELYAALQRLLGQLPVDPVPPEGGR